MKRTGRFLFLALALSLLAFVFATTTAPAASAPPDGVRVFVEYAPGQANAVQRTLNRAGANFHYDFPDLNSYAVTLPANAVSGIANSPHVVAVEDDPVRELLGGGLTAGDVMDAVNSTLAAETTPYGVNYVQAPDVWAAGYDGSGVTVCIIDSGYRWQHEDLPDTYTGYSQISGENVDDDGNGHGSHVAGTIGAIQGNGVGVVGVAPGVNFHIVKFFNFIFFSLEWKNMEKA